MKGGAGGGLGHMHVTHGRQRLNTQGVAPDCNNFHFMSTSIWCHSKEWYWQWLVNTLASSSLMDITRQGLEILHWALPLVRLPSVYLYHPGLPTLCLHTAKDRRLNGLWTRLTWIILCCVLPQLNLAPDFDCNLVDIKFPWREWRGVGECAYAHCVLQWYDINKALATITEDESDHFQPIFMVMKLLTITCSLRWHSVVNFTLECIPTPQITINPTCSFHGNKSLLISNDIIHMDEYAGVHDFYSDVMQRQWTNLISCRSHV